MVATIDSSVQTKKPPPNGGGFLAKVLVLIIQVER